MKKILAGIKKVFSNQDGNLDLGKLAFVACLIVVFYCGIHVLLKTNQMPDWSSGTLFCTSIYALHKGAEVITSHPSWQNGNGPKQ
jgi:hypothetical protein